MEMARLPLSRLLFMVLPTAVEELWSLTVKVREMVSSQNRFISLLTLVKNRCRDTSLVFQERCLQGTTDDALSVTHGYSRCRIFYGHCEWRTYGFQICLLRKRTVDEVINLL